MESIKATTFRYGYGYSTHSYTRLDYVDSLPGGEVYQVKPTDESRAQYDYLDFPGGIEFFEIERFDADGEAIGTKYVCRPDLNGRYTVSWEDDFGDNFYDTASFQEAKDLFDKYKSEEREVHVCDHQSDAIVMQYNPD